MDNNHMQAVRNDYIEKKNNLKNSRSQDLEI